MWIGKSLVVSLVLMSTVGVAQLDSVTVSDHPRAIEQTAALTLSEEELYDTYLELSDIIEGSESMIRSINVPARRTAYLAKFEAGRFDKRLANAFELHELSVLKSVQSEQLSKSGDESAALESQREALEAERSSIETLTSLIADLTAFVTSLDEYLASHHLHSRHLEIEV